VFGKVALEEWAGPAAETHLQDLNWVGPRACQHEQVIERVMVQAPVFPLPFGTLFSALEPVHHLLEARREAIAGFLDFVVDKEEWAVKGFLDKKAAEVHLMTSDPSREMLPSSQGARYLLERRRRARVGRELKSWVKEAGALVSRALQDVAVDFRPLKILARQVSGRDLDMVFNWAFLLERNTRETFRTQVEQLDAQHAEQGLRLELSGPWPPYSFCPSLEEEDGEWRPATGEIRQPALQAETRDRELSPEGDPAR